MAGLSPKLPVTQDPENGFALNKTFKQMIQQNFKNLMLTSPGERVMDPNFGVGLRRFLFEQIDAFVFSRIEERIRRQVSIYMPFIEVARVEFNTFDDQQISNALEVRVEYIITPLAENVAFEFTVNNT